MKPGVEDSSMMISSSCAPTSIALSTRETTSEITPHLHSHAIAGRRFSRRSGISCPFKCAIAIPAIVLIVTADSESGPKMLARYNPDGAGSSLPTYADADIGIHYRSHPHMRTVTPAFCDPVHSIKHRMPLFAYRGYRKRHHQRKEEACSQL